MWQWWYGIFYLVKLEEKSFLTRFRYYSKWESVPSGNQFQVERKLHNFSFSRLRKSWFSLKLELISTWTDIANRLETISSRTVNCSLLASLILVRVETSSSSMNNLMFQSRKFHAMKKKNNFLLGWVRIISDHFGCRTSFHNDICHTLLYSKYDTLTLTPSRHSRSLLLT